MIQQIVRRGMRLVLLIAFYCVPALSAPRELYQSEDLVEEVFHKLSYILPHLKGSYSFFADLDEGERDQLEQIIALIRSRPGQRLAFSEDRLLFHIESPKPERLAVTDSYAGPIIFNSGLARSEGIELGIPLIAQTLVHEWGHKLADKKVQVDVDSLATKVGQYLKAHTSKLQIEEATLHILSLPYLEIDRKDWPKLGSYHGSRRPPQQRPSFIILMEDSSRGFKNLSSNLAEVVLAASPPLNVGFEPNPESISETHAHFSQWEATEGQISVNLRLTKRLLPTREQIGYWFDEKYKQILGENKRLVLQFKKDNAEKLLHFVSLSDRPEKNLTSAVPSRLESDERGGERILRVPKIRKEPELFLRIQTQAGVILLKPFERGPTYLKFKYSIPREGSQGFIQVNSLQTPDGKVLPLANEYWSSVKPSEAKSPKDPIHLGSMGVHIQGQWIEAKEKGENPLLFGESSLRLRFSDRRPILQVKLIWSYTLLRYSQDDFYDPPFSSSAIFLRPERVVRGRSGAEFATEVRNFEDIISLNEIHQEESEIKFSLKSSMRHERERRYQRIKKKISWAYTFNQRIATDYLKGEDTGYRFLKDIQVTDHNLETHSLLNGKPPLVFFLSRDGSSFEELIHRRCEQLFEQYQ